MFSYLFIPFFLGDFVSKYFLIFLSFVSSSAYAGFGCITVSSTGSSTCYMDNGVSNLQLAVTGMIGLSSIGVAVFLIYKIMNK